MSDAISSHGTLIKRNGVTIGELRDITPPARTRAEFDVSTQNDDDDQYIVGGIRRRSPMTFQINYLPGDDQTHDDLETAYEDGTKDLYGVYYPDGSGALFSGFVTNVGPAAPVDGELSAAITIRPTGGHIRF
jgi:hypothetical protein